MQGVRGEAMSRPVGKPPNLRKKFFVERYGLTGKQRLRLTPRFVWQLCRCPTEAARRILLGKSQ